MNQEKNIEKNEPYYNKIISNNIDNLTEKFLLIKYNQATNADKHLFYETVLPMIQEHTAKYKKFSNYIDLNQFGFEAALTGLQSFNPKKGTLSCWLAYYIKTKIKRKASQHASFQIPLKNFLLEQDKKPIKIDELPIQIDTLTPERLCVKKQMQEKLHLILQNFSELEKKIYMYHFKFDDTYKNIPQLCKHFNIPKSKYKSILEKCLTKLKQ